MVGYVSQLADDTGPWLRQRGASRWNIRRGVLNRGVKLRGASVQINLVDEKSG